MITRRRASLVVGLALAAACGGSDVATTTTADGASAPTAAPTTSAATTTIVAPTTTTSTAAATTTVAAQGGDLESVHSAFAQTAAVPSGRMEGSIQMVGVAGLPAGTALVMPFSAQFDNEAGVFSFVMDMSGIAAAAGEQLPSGFEDLFGDMEVRLIGDTAYMRFGLFAMLLGEDVTWVEMPAAAAGSAAGSFGGASPGNPADLLSSLVAADADVVEVGADSVRGIAATHYLVTFDIEKLLAQATPEERARIEAHGPLPLDRLPMEIWIGEDGLVHRYVMDIDGTAVAATGSAEFERMVMTFEIFDHGAAIDIEAPPADEVTPYDALEGLFDF